MYALIVRSQQKRPSQLNCHAVCKEIAATDASVVALQGLLETYESDMELPFT